MLVLGTTQASPTAKRGGSYSLTPRAIRGRCHAPRGGPHSGFVPSWHSPSSGLPFSASSVSGALSRSWPGPCATSMRNPSRAVVRPETQGLLELLVDLRVLPVEVRLLLGEHVQVTTARPAPAPMRRRRKSTASRSGAARRASPRPSRKMYRSRVGDPGSAASASWNQTCPSEVWFGTMSRSPSYRPHAGGAAIASKSSMVPSPGSTSR